MKIILIPDFVFFQKSEQKLLPLSFFLVYLTNDLCQPLDKFWIVCYNANVRE